MTKSSDSLSKGGFTHAPVPPWAGRCGVSLFTVSREATDSCRRSFTLIEILFVIVILSVLLGVSLPQFRKTFNRLQFNSFSQQLQNFITYLQQRSIVEGEMIFFKIDNKKKEYWAGFQHDARRLKTYSIPKEIQMEMDKEEVIFYPDGTIEKASIKISDKEGSSMVLTTKGVFGGVKILAS